MAWLPQSTRHWAWQPIHLQCLSSRKVGWRSGPRSPSNTTNYHHILVAALLAQSTVTLGQVRTVCLVALAASSKRGPKRCYVFLLFCFFVDLVPKWRQDRPGLPLWTIFHGFSMHMECKMEPEPLFHRPQKCSTRNGGKKTDFVERRRCFVPRMALSKFIAVTMTCM